MTPLRMTLPQETIRAKRDGRALEPAQIQAFIAGLMDGRVTEGQAAAFAMAVYFQKLSLPERVALTDALMRSGTVLEWDLPGPVLDKHSTGGVGDAVSLALAPLVAACGGYVPMITGRGLGHTGGTLDKLASIPGYDVRPDLDRFRRVSRDVGCCVIGQTPDLAPADARLYAIRDVTGTVESLDLITASILSKKLAAGLDGLVMDVKIGSGAFMESLDAARGLGEAIVGVAGGAGLNTVALVTDMDSPLASAAGNALEVAYTLDYLAGRVRESAFHTITLELGAEMLVLGGLAVDLPAARERLTEALDTGRAHEIFSRMVTALGGPADLAEHPDRYLARAEIVRAVTAPEPGFVARVATRSIGLAVIGLGGGRTRPQDTIDPAVGFTGLARVGEAVGPDRPLGVIHARSVDAADAAEATLRAAYGVTEGSVGATPLLRDRIA